MSRQAMNYIFVEKECVRETLCMDKKNCGCVLKSSYGLPCACIIDMKICHNKPIRLDEIDRHWQKLFMGKEESNDEFFFFRSGGVEWYLGTYPNSLLPNETTNQRGFASVSVS